jgi:hypothetical protein
MLLLEVRHSLLVGMVDLLSCFHKHLGRHPESDTEVTRVTDADNRC